MCTRIRTERCSECRSPVPVQPRALTVRCTSCGAVTKVRAGHRDSVRHAASWVKNKVSSIHSGPAAAAAAARTSCCGGRGVAWPMSYPAVHGNKRAVLCGVSYYRKRYELKGSVNDVNCMKFLLTEKFDFPEECILVLTEDEKDAERIPTKENVRTAMRWLVYRCRAGDSLFFHFSGHGAQKLNTTDDELDGYDETICPLDYETNGMILDDEINETIVRPIPTGARLHAVVDACHSGTILDLRWVCRMNRAVFCQWEDHRPPSGVHKGTSGGLAICFSGCDDNQTSADTSALSRSVSTGAMTYSFILALETETGPTYGRMLTVMRSVIRGTNTGTRLSGPISSLIRKVFNCGLSQEPQLSSSEAFDVHKKPFLL